MTILTYDGTFPGFLSAVFYVYEYKLTAAEICRQPPASILFGSVIRVDTDEAKARRVWTGLSAKLTPAGLHMIYSSFLADTFAEENNMLAFIRHALTSHKNIENDFSNFAVLRAQRVERMVHREAHRMEAFIRFKLLKGDIYYCAIEPDFDVIPLIRSHFYKRYADQKWLIYDLRRRYGIYYDLEKVETISLDFDDQVSETGASSFTLDENEELYQTLWQQYFKSTNIISRKNMTLHIRHVPKRYWKYLTEKNVERREMR